LLGEAAGAGSDHKRLKLFRYSLNAARLGLVAGIDGLRGVVSAPNGAKESEISLQCKLRT